MIKISRLADYAVVILATLARSDEGLMTAAVAAGRTALPEPTVAKVMKTLARAGIVESARGPNGGYSLARGADKISVSEIIIAMDGPIALTACVEGATGCCDFSSHCAMKGRWNDVSFAIRNALEDVSLADMLLNNASPAKAGVLERSSLPRGRQVEQV